MPISGLVLTLDLGHLEATLAALSADPRVTVGPREGHRLALALETESQAADKAAWAELRALPGITWIDLAYITIDPDEADHPDDSPRLRSTT